MMLIRKYMTLVDLIKNHNANITEIEGKILGLITTTALNTVKSKVLNVFDLVKKLLDIEAKYFTTFDAHGTFSLSDVAVLLKI